MELKEYVRIVYELEVSIFQQKDLIQKLETQLSSLPRVPEEPNTKSDGSGTSAVTAILLAVALWCVIFFAPIGWGWKVLIGFFAVSLSAVGVAMLSCWDNDEARRACAKKDYQEQMQAYVESLPIKKELEVDLSSLKTKISDSESLLRTIYDKDLIFPKYRNLVAVSSIYEYLSSGRCEALEGANGAYNIFEQESRMDRIITRLDDVISNLGRIQNNQFMLYSAILQSNQKTEQLYQTIQEANALAAKNASDVANKLEQVQANTALIAYTAELTHKETEYRNMMELGTSYRRTL